MKYFMELIFEKSRPGKKGYKLPKLDVERVEPEEIIPEEYVRKELDFPEVSQLEVIRHYTKLSHLNYAVDTTMVPLGSCTMKYNPRVNEELVNRKEFLELHPFIPEEYIQPVLELIYRFKELLKELGGFAEVSLQPAAGAHGELLGLLLIRAYHDDKGNKEKNVILIPDSAHGTNPATAAICGFEIKVIKSNKDGELDFEDFKRKLNDKVAGLMITNPNTLGIFERKIKEIAHELHKIDALLYMDGANFNALVGKFKPGVWGVDIMHFNLHKTFSTPHGGGGPGAGPVGVSEKLKQYLPVPHIDFDGKKYFLNWNIPKSVGKVLGFWGHFSVWLKAFAYILTYGNEIGKISEYAVLNARYLKYLLQGVFKDPYPQSPCMHEFVLSAVNLIKHGVKAGDVAKRILDYGFYAPTMYFPLIVREALMIEPTETEGPDTLRTFAQVLRRIVKEAKEKPEILKKAPHNTPVKRIKEAEANRNLILKYKDILERKKS